MIEVESKVNVKVEDKDKVPERSRWQVEGLINRNYMQMISAQELFQKLSNGDEITLIDVREPWEHELNSIGGQLIPLNDIVKELDSIPTDKPVVFYCRKGIRSQIAIQKLVQKKSFENLYNLTGGMESWEKEIGE